jgi:uracil-DNA glycosylase
MIGVMNSNHDYYLQEMGVDVYRVRLDDREACAKWEQLAQEVAACRACALCETRTQTVFGVGDHHADLVVVGEAPGYYEDLQGEPFVGRAGKLLDAILQAVGLQRQQVYIANVLKCRPPKNRDPQMTEVLKCTPFLERQLDLLQPKLIVATGRHAAHFLLGTTASLGSLRGQVHEYRGIPLRVTYHTAYLLRNPRDKFKAMQDWWAIAKQLNLFSN